MSRAGPSRNLTLTEELEKLEQSITLTLQEIDHNFSKAHRIVTTSILPLVEQYGEHSKSVWESSKFWKQFFEASANVSLSGYEELADEAETTRAEETALEDTTDYTATPADNSVDQSGYDEQQQQQDHHGQEDETVEGSVFEMDGEMSGSTPRAPATKSMNPQFANLDSPYERLRREMKADDDTETSARMFSGDDDETMELPAQSSAAADFPNISTTPRSSSILEEPALQQQLSAKRSNKDALLHRVLDKNYRLQATPLKSSPRKVSPDKRGDQTRRQLWTTDSPMSSPEMAVPKLRSDLYTMSPVKSRKLGVGSPRTPGVSVQTPGAGMKKHRDVFAAGADTKGKGKASSDPDEITWESDSEEDTNQVFGGMSPPKTIQFAMPQSKLMQTPAREASRRIIDDILIRAGAAPDESEEHSPTMVKMNHDITDDTF